MSKWYNGPKQIESKDLVPVRKRWICPECGEGEMVFNGQTWPCIPTGYHHTCNQCRFTGVLRDEQYPAIAYREV